MIGSAITAMLGITAILGGWLVVQILWNRVSGVPPGADALRGRLGCHSCDCQSVCKDESHQAQQLIQEQE